MMTFETRSTRTSRNPPKESPRPANEDGPSSDDPPTDAAGEDE
jgi:hypothetical protein